MILLDKLKILHIIFNEVPTDFLGVNRSKPALSSNELQNLTTVKSLILMILQNTSIQYHISFRSSFIQVMQCIIDISANFCRKSF